MAEHMTDTDHPSPGAACANDAQAFTFKCGGELYRVVEVLDEDGRWVRADGWIRELEVGGVQP